MFVSVSPFAAGAVASAWARLAAAQGKLALASTKLLASKAKLTQADATLIQDNARKTKADANVQDTTRKTNAKIQEKTRCAEREQKAAVNEKNKVDAERKATEDVGKLL